MQLKLEREAILTAMVLGRDAVERLIARSPDALKSDLLDVQDAIDHVIRLLERSAEPPGGRALHVP